MKMSTNLFDSSNNDLVKYLKYRNNLWKNNLSNYSLREMYIKINYVTGS